MFDGGNHLIALTGVVPQPVQQLRESPFRRIDPTAGPDRRQLHLVCNFGDPRRFSCRAVIAPEVVVAERLAAGAEWNDRGAGGVECQRLDLGARDIRIRQSELHGVDQRGHVRVVRLRGEVGISAVPLDRVLRRTETNDAADVVHN